MKRIDVIGIAFALLSLAVFAVGIRGLQTNTEDVLQWLPDQSEAREKYDFFESQFGGDDFLILTWDGCTVDDPRLPSVTQRLRNADREDLFQSITHGGELIDELSAKLNMSPGSVVKRFRGVFFGANDVKSTSLMILLSTEGTARRRDCMDMVWQAIDDEPNLDRDSIGIGGYPFIATFIDEQLLASYRKCLIPSIVMSTLLALLCLRNFRLTCIVFVTAGGASALSVAMIPICGVMYGGLMSIIPALVFVLATSGSIHLIRYGLNVIGDPNKLLRIGWKPCSISAMTTAVGMLSLARSEFPAIRNFGIFCAIGVIMALAFQLILVPWLLYRFGESGLLKLDMQSSQSTFWERLLEQIQKRKFMVAIVSLGLMIGGGVGLTRLKAEVEVEKLFRQDSQIIHSLTELEERLGPMDQTELLVVFNEVDQEQFPSRVKLIRRIQSMVKRIPEIQVVYSLINALPAEPKSTSVRNLVRRTTYRDILKRERENLANSDLLYVDETDETWRISIRFPFTKNMDFDRLKVVVVEAGEQAVQRFQFDDPDHPKPELVYTGKTHLFQHAQTNLLKDLFYNFLLAFFIITPMLIIVLRSIPIGLIAMIPNLFPTLTVFGSLGWYGYPVDLAIAMTACVALGIAVDDTTHFLIRFRDFGGGPNNMETPMRETIRQCGPAMLHTTLIGSAGLAAYYFSQMLVVSRFSWAIITLLVVALLADVLMLPAILFLLGRRNVQPAQEFVELKRRD